MLLLCDFKIYRHGKIGKPVCLCCCRYSAGSPQALRGGVLPDGVLLESGRAAAEAARLRPLLLL